MASRNQRLDATISIGSVVQKSFSKNIGLIRSGLDSVGDEIKQITDRQRELSKQRRVLERQGRSVEELDREYEGLNRTLGDLRRSQERFERAQRSANRVGQEFRRTTATIGRIGRRAAVGIGAVGGAIAGVAVSASDSVSQINDAAKRLDMRPEELSELTFAARQFGVDSGAMIDGLKEMQIRADEFAESGKGGGAEAFERLGLSRDRIAEAKGDAQELFDLVQGRIADVEDAAARQRIADEVFGGQGGEQLVELLAVTRQELEELRQEARRAGATVTEEQGRAAREFERSYRRVGTVFDSIKRNVASELHPVLTEALNDLSDDLIEGRGDAKRFGRALGEALEDAIPVAREVSSGIGDVIGVTGEAIGKVKDLVGGWENLGRIVAGAVAAKVFLGVARMGIAIAGLIWSTGTALASIKAIGPAMTAAARTTEAATGRMGRAISRVNFGGLAFGAQTAWMLSQSEAGERTNPETGLPIVGHTNQEGNARGIEGRALDLPVVGHAMRGAAQLRYRLTGKAPDSTLDDPMSAYGLEGVTPGGGRPGSGFNPMTGAGRPQQRAIGGAFGAGPLLVGERGPELIYPNRGGFVAHHRALERMAELNREIKERLPDLGVGARNPAPVELPSFTARVDAPAPPEVPAPNVSVMPAPVELPSFTARVDAPAPPEVPAPNVSVMPAAIQKIRDTPTRDDRDLSQGGAQRIANVTQNITINAPQGMSVDQLVAELERRRRDAENDALFDGAAGWGQYGGAYG
jgi:hypothetical protein